MQTPRESIMSRSLRNRLPCSVPACRKVRHRVSRFCAAHGAKNATLGDPLARRIFPKEYAKERAEIAAFLEQQREHEGVRVALSWIADYMRDSAAANPKTPGQAEMATLARYEVDPARILQEVASLYLFAERNPTSLPDRGRVLPCALGTVCTYIVPRELIAKRRTARCTWTKYRRATGTARHEIGQAIRATLGVLLHRITEAIAETHAANERAREALRQPFPSLTTEGTSQ